MPNLYQLADEFNEIQSQLENMDVDEQTLADTMEAISFPIEEKAINVGLMIRNLESLADQIKEAEASMKSRREAAQKRADWLRAYLLQAMNMVNKPKIENAFLSLSVRKNKASVIIDVESAVPREYWVQPKAPEPIISKTLIKEAIDAGQQVPGAHIEQTERVQIK